MGGENGKLLDASRSGSEARAAKAIRKGAEVAFIDADGKAPLHYASKQGFADVVRLLLQHKAEVDIRSEGNGDTPLLKAARAGQLKVVRALLEHGASINLRPRSGDLMSGRKSAREYAGVLQIVQEVRLRQKEKIRDVSRVSPPHELEMRDVHNLNRARGYEGGETPTTPAARDLHARVLANVTPRGGSLLSPAPAMGRRTPGRADPSPPDNKSHRKGSKRSKDVGVYSSDVKSTAQMREDQLDDELRETLKAVNALDNDLLSGMATPRFIPGTPTSLASPSRLPLDPYAAHPKQAMCLPTMGCVLLPRQTVPPTPPPPTPPSATRVAEAKKAAEAKKVAEQAVALAQAGWGGGMQPAEPEELLEVMDSSDTDSDGFEVEDEFADK